MTRDEAEEAMQRLLVEMTGIVSVMNDLAIEHEIAKVPFMGSFIHFGTDFRGSWSSVEGADFKPAAMGPIMSDEYWQASSFACWPSAKQLEWMYGDGPRPRTDYDD